MVAGTVYSYRPQARATLIEEATYKGKIRFTTSLPCNKSTDGKRTSGVVKIEAELILEANRLQLIRNKSLEKRKNAYLRTVSLRRESQALPSATAAAHGDPNGKNDYQKKVVGVFVAVKLLKMLNNP
ncbi:hypothetical protein TNCV_1717841 [Trichonephila clavipes]|nr:hypothetical protein TNCV_1717841 [Trichonephila clavipes]